jgi:hypothetical protein
MGMMKAEAGLDSDISAPWMKGLEPVMYEGCSPTSHSPSEYEKFNEIA